MTPPDGWILAVEQAHRAMRDGNIKEAAALMRTAIAAHPDSAEAWLVLGQAMNALKDFNASERAFEEAARLSAPESPTQAHILVLRAEPLICLGRPTEAVETTRMAIEAGLSDPGDFFMASLALSHAGLPLEALPLAEKATELAPKHAEAWHIVGNARQFLGDIAGAEAAYRTVISLSRDHLVSAFHSLAHLKRWKAETNPTAVLETLQCRSSQEACRVGYTLFKVYDDLGDVEMAWDCLVHGAHVARTLEGWSATDEQVRFEAWKRAFPAERFEVKDDRPRSGPKRIFIVGLPRSGTTLVERILTSHSQVQAIGEVNTFAIATRKLARPDAPGLIRPDIIAASTTVDPLDIAEFYTRETDYLSDGSAYTIDKRPDNYEYVGLLRLAFPDALIISLDRNPMDALFGAYKRIFNTGAHGWSYTQDDLADHYGLFKDLMSYWKRTLGEGLIEVSLEELILDPETQIRQLLEACGLPFEDACLKPHQSKGAVTTASAVQVRKPINTEGMGAWKRYESLLAPLHQRLKDMGYSS